MIMDIKTETFLQYIESTTTAMDSCVMVMRTVGPDACTDSEKINTIYSAYKNNMDEENTEVFPTFLANEWTFLTFNTEEQAREFARDNLPLDMTDDPDYFVQAWVFVSGGLSWSNDNLTKLSHRVAG